MSTSCILIPVLVGLISGILGYLIGKMGAGTDDNSALMNLQAEMNSIKTQLDECRAELRTCQMNLSNAEAAPLAAPLFDRELASNIFGRKILEDDLKVIEGIGPKIEELYHATGIRTWLALAQTSKERSLQILHDGGERFAMHDPTTWAKQAELAYQGKWKELKVWQEKLKGGKEE
jgi:predicted flap endonuclease-1-like 5' DNA nuclease